jgi:hypothetical protein
MHNLLSIPPIRYHLRHLLCQASSRLERLPPSVAVRNSARTRGATGILAHEECLPILPVLEYEAPPFHLPHHLATPAWSNARFTVHQKPESRDGFGLSKRALKEKNAGVWKIWVMVTEGHASEWSLAMYCIFKDDTPFVSDYTPFQSPGGLLLALSLARGRVP